MQWLIFFWGTGDGNVHVNLTSAQFTKTILDLVEPFIYERVSVLRGSVSAEHGIGFMKTKYLKYSKTENEITMMRRLKSLMDANGILNPEKVLPWIKYWGSCSWFTLRQSQTVMITLNENLSLSTMEWFVLTSLSHFFSMFLLLCWKMYLGTITDILLWYYIIIVEMT